MKRVLFLIVVAAVVSAAWLMAQTQPAEVSLVDGFRTVEVASVSDAIEQLYGQRAYMSHDMRPVSPTKFAGPAVTVQLKKERRRRRACWTRSTRRQPVPFT
jgi:regulator of RNase E activity RraA